MKEKEKTFPSAAFPRLRSDLEYIPCEYDGQKAVLVRDPLGLIPEPILLQGEVLFLLGLLNGERSVRDIQSELVRSLGGVLVGSEAVERMLARLDESLLLEGEKYSLAKDRSQDAYSRLRTRPPSHAGTSYPSAEEELVELLDDILSGAPTRPETATADRVVALIAPHIDFEAGRRVYGKAYNRLRHQAPETVFLLGTGHSLADRVSFTEKDFETPLGLVRTDREAVRFLQSRAGSAGATSDIAHRHEHSLEFQIVFLQRLFGSDFRLVPVLCGSFGRDLKTFSRAADIPGLGGLIEAWRELLTETGGERLLIAGVDLSHVGPKFGHSFAAGSVLERTREHDGRLLEACCGKNPAGFWEEISRVDDRFNVCGFSALVLLLEILPPGCGRGVVLDYDIWEEGATSSAVSFAAVAFPEA